MRVEVLDVEDTWSNYRFPGSGTTVVSAIENEVSGMFVLRPTLEDTDNGRGGGKGGGKPDRR